MTLMGTPGTFVPPTIARRPLRIAVIAPPWFSVPPRAYGGIEEMLANLVDALVDRGHRVTLIGAGPALTRAQEFIPVYDDPPSDRLGEPMPEVLHSATAWRILDDLDVDVIHDNTLAGALGARGAAAPVVATAHGAVAGELGRYFCQLADTVNLVAISDAQRCSAPDLNWVARVHNAVDVHSFPFGRGGGDYLLFLGRFAPDKGAHLAIDAARRTGRRLVLAGKLNEPTERAYFESAVRPHLGRDITYVGEADAALKRELYADAAALLFPVCWEEPFGMVMVEAMACGTPVIALRRGSVPEVVDHGRTGFVLDHAEDLADAIQRIDTISRDACRRHVSRRFDVPVMAAGYEAVYRHLSTRSTGSRSSMGAPHPIDRRLG